MYAGGNQSKLPVIAISVGVVGVLAQMSYVFGALSFRSNNTRKWNRENLFCPTLALVVVVMCYFFTITSSFFRNHSNAEVWEEIVPNLSQTEASYFAVALTLMVVLLATTALLSNLHRKGWAEGSREIELMLQVARDMEEDARQQALAWKRIGAKKRIKDDHMHERTSTESGSTPEGQHVAPLSHAMFPIDERKPPLSGAVGSSRSPPSNRDSVPLRPPVFATATSSPSPSSSSSFTLTPLALPSAISSTPLALPHAAAPGSPAVDADSHASVRSRLQLQLSPPTSMAMAIAARDVLVDKFEFGAVRSPAAAAASASASASMGAPLARPPALATATPASFLEYLRARSLLTDEKKQTAPPSAASMRMHMHMSQPGTAAASGTGDHMHKGKGDRSGVRSLKRERGHGPGRGQRSASVRSGGTDPTPTASVTSSVLAAGSGSARAPAPAVAKPSIQ